MLDHVYRSSHLMIFSYCNDMMKVLFYNQGSLSCILHLHYYNYMLLTTGIMYGVIACLPQQFVYNNVVVSSSGRDLLFCC